MDNRDINLKPFKNDEHDKHRQYDLLRAVVIFRELIRIKFNTSKLQNSITNVRRDIPQYAKLLRKYPTINLCSLNEIAKSNRFKIIIWTKNSSRSKANKVYETKNSFVLGCQYLCIRYFF